MGKAKTMGAMANEKRRITKIDHYRRDGSFLAVAPGNEFIKGPRFIVSLGKLFEGEARIVHTLKFFNRDFAYKMRDVLSKDWPIAIVGETPE